MTNEAQSARLRWTLAALILLSCVGGSGPAAPLRAQGDDERRLWDTEFLQKRPAAKAPVPATSKKPPVYRRATPKSNVNNDQPQGEVLGVTIWRMRPPSAADNQDSRLLLQEEDTRDNAEWTPERVEAETTFTAGERVRLSVESPRTGFLYVIDREQYADGSTSDPYLIFPTLRIRAGDNAVAAGRVIELPDRSAFRLKPMRPDYKGELLTLLVTSEAFAEIAVGPRLQKLDAKLVEQWERQWAATTERFEMVGGAGKTYTKTEKEAGAEGRLLTQEDELPQTLLHIIAKPGSPILVALPLRVDN